jgi:hypothetical protein
MSEPTNLTTAEYERMDAERKANMHRFTEIEAPNIVDAFMTFIAEKKREEAVFTANRLLK